MVFSAIAVGLQTGNGVGNGVGEGEEWGGSLGMKGM